MNDESRPFFTAADSPSTPPPPGVTPTDGAEVTTRRDVWLKLTLVFAITALLLGLHILLPLAAVRIAQIANPAFLQRSEAVYLLDLVPFYVIAVPLCAFLLTRLPQQRPERRAMSVGSYIGWLCVGLTFVAAGNLVGQAITGIISAFTGHETTSANDLLGVGNVWWALLFIGVLAPIFEEIIFRKFLIDALRRYGEGTAILLSSLVFGLAHGNFTQCFYAFGLGLVLGVLYCRTGRLLLSILPHMILNTCSTLLSFFVLPKLTFLYDLDSVAVEEMFDSLLSVLPALLIFGLYTAAFYGGALAGLILIILRAKKWRPVRSSLLLEAPAGGFYHPLTGRDVRVALAKSPGFWLMIAVSACLFVLSVIPLS